MLTAERLREILEYDPETGVFRWRGVLSGRGYSHANVAAGVEAGALDTKGYRLIGIDRRLYRANRLAWLYMTGQWPPRKVDHRDTDQSNDAWDNLRLASNSQNGANARLSKRNKTGLKGVSIWQGRYMAQICKDHKRYRLGSFDTPEEAHAAYMAAAHRLHGEFARAA